nr:hypothetical protein [uncultured Rhodopila sp.]
MAATATVGAEEIGRAGEAILAQNRPVTGYSLRMQLGNRGDPKRLMAVWKQTQPDVAAPAGQLTEASVAPLPPDLAARAAALGDQLAASIRDAIATAWTAAERRAAERLGDEVAAARAAAEAARLAQAEADEALAATDAAMAVLVAERDQAVTAAEKAISAAAHTAGERNRIAAELATARAASTEAERRAAAAEAARETALAAAQQARAEAREATAAAMAVREQAAADVATARAEAAATRTKVEATQRNAAAKKRVQEPEATDPKPSAGDNPQEARNGVETPGRSARPLGAAGPDVTAPSAASDETVAKPASEAQPDDLPVVLDRLKLPKAERAAYDDGVTCGVTGRGEKPSRRFQPGQRLAHLLPFNRAGYRDGVAKVRARRAAAAASDRAEPPSAVSAGTATVNDIERG